MAPRRQPQRIPLTRDIGNKARIRKRVDAQTYMLDIGSRVGSPAIGFYIGSLILKEGELVLVTWRAESDLYDIVGPVRESPPSDGIFVIGGTDNNLLDPTLWLRSASPAGVVSDVEVEPPPPASADRINTLSFSPDGRFLAAAYTDTGNDGELSVYEYSAGALGALLDTIALPNNETPALDQYGLSWHPDSGLIAVGYDDGTGDSLSIYSWDGAALALVHSEADPAGSSGCVAAEWHPDGVHLAAGYQSADSIVYSWDGATLTFVDSLPQSGFGTLQFKWSPSGAYLLEGLPTATSRVAVIPWNGSVLGTRIVPSTLPPSGNTYGVAWYPQEDRIVVITDNDGVSAYPWTGTFGARVFYDTVTRIRRDVAVDPTGAYFVTAIHGAIDPDDPTYGEVFTFDGTTLARTQEFGHPQLTVFDELRGLSVAFPPGSAGPTELLTAEAIVDLPLGSFVALTGSPAYAQVGTRMQAWAFDAAADEDVVYSFTVPPGYISGGSFRLRYVMASAISGSVVVSVDALSVVETEDFDAAGAAATVTDAVQTGASDDLGVVDVTPVVAYAAGRRVRLIVGREGADGADDAAGDMWLVGVEFRYTAAL